MINNEPEIFDTLIIGSGLAGLSAANELAKNGSKIIVVDKGRGVGGRLASRRIGEAVFDHGAQFFTARSAPFKACVAKWIEADNLEKVKLESKKCWRGVTEEDDFDWSKDEVIPIVCVYTRKRCGRFKRRAVALGNKQTNCIKAEIYSPTVSHACNRSLACHAAANGRL